MTIEWQSTVAQLNADPDIGTPAGTAVLSGLVAAGRQYEAAHRPDVLIEAADHLAWRALPASQRLTRPEPQYHVAAYSARPFAPRLGGYRPERHPKMPDGATPTMKASYAFWVKRDGAIANRFVIHEIDRLAREANARLPLGPTNGAIEQGLVSALSAAEAWLAS